jgi:hypothetical protein
MASIQEEDAWDLGVFQRNEVQWTDQDTPLVHRTIHINYARYIGRMLGCLGNRWRLEQG